MQMEPPARESGQNQHRAGQSDNDRALAVALRTFDLEFLLLSDEPWGEVLLRQHPLLARLLKATKALGYHMRFVPNPSYLSDTSTTIGGCIYPNSRTILVSRTFPGVGRLTIAELAFILAHELRHALHIADGLYSNYYFGEGGVPPMDVHITPEAFEETKSQAELDCNVFAAAYIARYGAGKPTRLGSDELRHLGEKYQRLFT